MQKQFGGEPTVTEKDRDGAGERNSLEPENMKLSCNDGQSAFMWTETINSLYLNSLRNQKSLIEECGPALSD